MNTHISQNLDKKRFVLLSALLLAISLLLTACGGAAGAAGTNIVGTFTDDVFARGTWTFNPNGEFTVEFNENWSYRGQFEIEDGILSLEFHPEFFGTSLRDTRLQLGEVTRNGFNVYDYWDEAREHPAVFTRVN